MRAGAEARPDTLRQDEDEAGKASAMPAPHIKMLSPINISTELLASAISAAHVYERGEDDSVRHEEDGQGQGRVESRKACQTSAPT